MISTIPKFQKLLGKAISRTLLLAFLRKTLSKKKKSLEIPKQAKEGAVNFCEIHLIVLSGSRYFLHYVHHSTLRVRSVFSV